MRYKMLGDTCPLCNGALSPKNELRECTERNTRTATGESAGSRSLAESGGLRKKLVPTAFRSMRDVGLFLVSSRADARLRTLQRELPTAAAAFDHLYTEAPNMDPWASDLPQYQYQKRKHEALVKLLPPRRFRKAIELGCGIGLLTKRLSSVADEVLGIDISATAVRRARERLNGFANVRFKQGDIAEIAVADEDRADLVVVADTIYYLPPPIRDETLKRISLRIADILAPDGLLLVANHYFFVSNADTRLTRRIHSAFYWSPSLALVSEHRHAFFLASLFSRNAEKGHQR